MADSLGFDSQATPQAQAVAQANGVPIPTPIPPAPKRPIQGPSGPTENSDQNAQAPDPQVEPAENNMPVQSTGESPPWETEEEKPPWNETSEANKSGVENAAADNSSMRKVIEENLKAHVAQYGNNGPVGPLAQQKTEEADSFLKSLEAGWQTSVSGLGIRQKMPSVVMPEHANRAFQIANQIGSIAGDMPAMVLGGVLGTPIGALAGTATLPVVGTVAGGVVGGAAGSFALPASLRKVMMDHYEKGDITTAGDFANRLMSTSWEAIKGGTTGAATAIAGPMAPTILGPMGKIGAELATMTTVASAMEGHFPHADDFINGAIVLGGFHVATGLVSSKLRNIYAQTGERPEQVLEETQSNPDLKQQLLSHDKEQPQLASPVDLSHEQVNVGTEEAPKIQTQTKLVPQDLSIKPDEPSPVEHSPEAQEILSKIGEVSEPEPKTFKEKFDQWYAKSVDWTDPLKVAYAAFKDKTGTDLSAEENPHVQARLFSGSVDQLRMILEHGFQDESGKFDGQGLNDIYRRVPDDNQAGFDAYSMAKRALELSDAGKTPWSDFNREGAEKVVAEGASKYEDLHQERVDFMNKILDYGVEKGVIDPDIAEASKENNKEYIPFNRIIPPDELTGEIGGTGKLVQKIEGSELDLKNPRMSIYDNVAAIVRRAAINDVRLKTLENLSYNDESGNLTNDFVKEVPIEGSLKKNQIAIFRDGKMSALEGTPLVIDSLKRLEGDPTMAGLVTKMAAQFSKAVRIGTVIDPSFGLRHFFRSAVMSGVYTQTGQIPFYHSALSLGEFMAGKSDTYKNWLYDGGSVASMDKLSESYIDNNLQEDDSKFPFLDKAWNVIKKSADAPEAYIKMTDNLSRFTEYKRALDQGKSRDEAAFLSREVTPDFQKVGLQRSALRTSVAFQGAHINSLDRMRQSFVEDPQGTILRMSVLSGISAAVWMINKDDQEVNDLPEYKKDLYWNFNVSKMFDSNYDKNAAKNGGASGTIFSVPKPWGPGILFGSGIERTLDAFLKHDPDAMKGFGKSLFDSVAPNLIPTALAPVLDQFANKNIFSGRQLVNNEQQKLLPEMQYQPYTSETAKQISKIISYVPAVKDIGPSSDPISSPEVIDNYIKGWTGTAGGWAIKIADAGLRTTGVTAKNVGPGSVESSVADLPMLNEFMTRFPSMKSQPIQTFYQNLDETDKVLNSIKVAAKAGDFDAAQRIAKTNPDLMFKLTGISTGMSSANKLIKLVQSNPDIAPTEKRQIIDTALFQMGSMAKMGNKMMNDFKNSKPQPQGGP